MQISPPQHLGKCTVGSFLQLQRGNPEGVGWAGRRQALPSRLPCICVGLVSCQRKREKVLWTPSYLLAFSPCKLFPGRGNWNHWKSDISSPLLNPWFPGPLSASEENLLIGSNNLEVGKWTCVTVSFSQSPTIFTHPSASPAWILLICVPWKMQRKMGRGKRRYERVWLWKRRNIHRRMCKLVLFANSVRESPEFLLLEEEEWSYEQRNALEWGFWFCPVLPHTGCDLESFLSSVWVSVSFPVKCCLELGCVLNNANLRQVF